MKSTAWGDHIAIQGLADLLHVDIHIITTSHSDMEPVKSPYSAIGTLHLGLMGSHHVSLHRDFMRYSGGGNKCHQPVLFTKQLPYPQPPCVQARPTQQWPVPSLHQEEREQTDDYEVFHYQAQLRGLPYDTVILRKDDNVSADYFFSVAPGEGQRHIPILSDEGFEEMCNPHQISNWQVGLTVNQEKKPTVCRYLT